MKKSMHKISILFALILAFCFAFSLAACDNNTVKSITEIELNKTTLTLEIGQTELLSVSVKPELEFEATFESDNSAVVTVDEYGLVTAISAGEANVTATVAGIKATCRVKVNAKAEVKTINGFKPFEKGGLIGGAGSDGTYYPVEATAVGDNAVKFSGKGGFSWPDTANNPVPDAMGGYYDSELNLDGLKFTWKLDKPIEFSGDYWYVVALANQKQLFNSWNGEDPVKTMFIMIGFDDDGIYLMPHYRDVVTLGESWSYLGRSASVEYVAENGIAVEFHKTDAGFEIYLNGELCFFDNIKSNFITVTDDLFENDKVYLLAGAHIGNPGSQYEGEYAYTLGIDKTASSLVAVQSIAFANAAETLSAGDERQLTVNITPENASNKNVIYISSNTGVATVDGTGKVTAIGEGEATITADASGKTAACVVTVEAAKVPATGITMAQATATVEQFKTVELTASVQPADASNKNVTWTVADNADNVTVVADETDAQKAVVTGKFIGTCTVKATIGEFTATCEVTVTQGSLNGFSQFAPGGLVGGREYDSHITVEAAGPDAVKFTGKGGTNWGDTTTAPSTMGGFYNDELGIDGLTIYYSVEAWVQGGDHWYYIALTDGNKDELFGNTESAKGTLFFMFAYDNGYVTLNAHCIGAGYGWTNIGRSQGVVAAGGQYSIKFVAVEGGYSVYMKNAGDADYTLQDFGGTTVISTELMSTLFGEEHKAFLQAGAYVATFEDSWAFVLGVKPAE